MQRWTRLWVGVAVACAVVVLIVVATLWLVPIALLSGGGGNPADSDIVSVNGRLYASETHELFGSDVPWWDNYTFIGVFFSIHFFCGMPTPGGAALCGNATEPNGSGFTYWFWDGVPQPNPPWQTTISPDGGAGAQYMDGGQFRLLVEVIPHPPF
jgi:hypothetical protein